MTSLVTLISTGLEDYFHSIEIADINLPKSPYSWDTCIANLGLVPADIVVVGDNRIGDIIAAHTIGVKHKVLLPAQLEVNAYGNIPDGTIISSSLLNLPDDLASHLL